MGLAFADEVQDACPGALALLDAPASGRMAVGEALTNIAAAPIADIGQVRLSANWMAAAGYPEKAIIRPGCNRNCRRWPQGRRGRLPSLHSLRT